MNCAYSYPYKQVTFAGKCEEQSDEHFSATRQVKVDISKHQKTEKICAEISYKTVFNSCKPFSLIFFNYNKLQLLRDCYITQWNSPLVYIFHVNHWQNTILMVELSWGHTLNGRRSISAPWKGGVAMSIIEILTLGILICSIIDTVINCINKKK